MNVERSVDINASVERVWAVLSDVERWPEWSESMDSVRLDVDTLQPGARAVVKQPRLPEGIWHVTDVRPPRSFTWVSSKAGVTSTACHELTATPTGCRARLSIELRGLLAPLVRLFAGRLISRYVDLEARGLKQRSERGESPPS